jgi:hypothetical protein
MHSEEHTKQPCEYLHKLEVSKDNRVVHTEIASPNRTFFHCSDSPLKMDGMIGSCL